MCHTAEATLDVSRPVFEDRIISRRAEAMLNEFLFTKIEEKDIGNIWFQQDGAMCHIAEATLGVLRPVFGVVGSVLVY